MGNNSDAVVSGAGDYGHTDYEAKQFNGRGECLDYIWDNKALLVEELFRIHGIHEDGRKLKTWGFYCEARKSRDYRHISKNLTPFESFFKKIL